MAAYLRAHPDTNDWRVVISLTFIGQWHAFRGDRAAALACADKAMALFERIEASGGYFPWNMLGRIGAVYYLLDDLDRAHDFFVRAIPRDEKISPPDHWIIAEDLQYLSQTLFRLDRYEEAVPVLERALPIRAKYFGPDHSRTYNTTRGLAIALLEVRDTAKARPYYRRVLELNEKIENIGWLYYSVHLANLVRDIGEHDDARRLYEDVIERAERQGVDQLKPALLGYAELLRRMGREAQAAEIDAQATNIHPKSTAAGGN